MPDRSLSPGALTLVLCLAEALGMAGTMTVPTLLPVFLEEWRLTTAEAGWLTGVAHLGYVLAVPVLLALTDRVDSRRIYVLCTALTVASCAGFALFVEGFWTAMLFRALGGVGLAGTYMPGLRILSDHIAGPRQARCMSFYTATYGVGAALSALIAGTAVQAGGWPLAFWLSTAAVAGALALALALVPATPPPPEQGTGGAALFDFRPVLRNPPAMGYILAYAAHCWELFGYRSWIAAFLAFAAGAGTGEVPGTVTALVTAALLLGVPSSILGNEAALRWGRNRFLTVIMLASAVLAALLGFAAVLPFWMLAVLSLVYVVTVTADSASLTVGMVGASSAGRRGAAMAMHSLFGFGAAFVAPIAFGLVLEAAGGRGAVPAWGLAFASLGVVVALGPLALRVLGRR
ncbi:MFS transporter [Azospirillum sp. ST 5-10]|uniref:MFS transporter n=1 Tax=unclassified Azospirillum TaxID=2630922 RepID=UPI003F49DE5C